MFFLFWKCFLLCFFFFLTLCFLCCSANDKKLWKRWQSFMTKRSRTDVLVVCSQNHSAINNVPTFFSNNSIFIGCPPLVENSNNFLFFNSFLKNFVTWIVSEHFYFVTKQAVIVHNQHADLTIKIETNR